MISESNTSLGTAGSVPAAIPGPRSARVLVMPHGVALLVVMLTFWTVDIVSPALPAIKDDLALSATGAGLVFSLMFLGRLLGNFPATYLLERSGAVIVALVGGAFLAGSSALAAVAPGIAILLVARVLQGAGISLVANAGLRSFLASRPAQGAAMTSFGIAATIGGIFGLQSGGTLTDEIGWRSIFVLSAALAIAVSCVAIWSMANRAEPVNAPVAASAAGAERSRRALAVPAVLNFVVFVNFSIWVALPLYAEREFGAASNDTARLLMVITAVHLVAAVPVGRVIRSRGSSKVLVAGLFVSLSGTVLVLASPSMVWMVIPLVLYGVGQVAAMNAGGDIVLQRGGASSRAIGLVRLSSDFGLVVGPVVSGALSDVFGYGAPFVALPMLMAVAGLASIVLLIYRPRTGPAIQQGI